MFNSLEQANNELVLVDYIVEDWQQTETELILCVETGTFPNT